MDTLQNCYYVYLLLDPLDFYKPFYVGKGKGDRMFTHLQENSRGENRFKDNKIAKIRRGGAEPAPMIWLNDLTEEEAYKLEAELIARFGRRNIDKDGILTNICMDARPPSQKGREVSEETRKKLSERQLGALNHFFGKSHSEEHKQRLSMISKEKNLRPPVRRGPMSEEQKKKISEANKGKKRSPEISAKLSALRKGKKRGPPSAETIEKIRQSNIGIKKRPRTDIEKAILSEYARKQWEEGRFARKKGDRSKDPSRPV